MENVMANGFVELSSTEMDAIDGGYEWTWKWYDNVGLATFGLSYLGVKGLVYCYNQGYEEGYYCG